MMGRIEGKLSKGRVERRPNGLTVVAGTMDISVKKNLKINS